MRGYEIQPTGANLSSVKKDVKMQEIHTYK